MRWMDAKKPILGLSPMADFTDLPFCRLIRDLDKETVLFREMVAAEAIVRKNKKTLAMCELEPIEHPVVYQLFGSNPETMAKAAQIIEKQFQPDGIDINMGCPVPKATSQYNGAFLMRDKERAVNIVSAIKDAINIPLSVKTRLGWDDPDSAVVFVKALQDAGAEAIEIHGRTKVQGYSGVADWEAVGNAIKVLDIPAFVNGDIIDIQTAKQALEQSGASGCLIGRGALGRPWVFNAIRNSLTGGQDYMEPALDIKMDLMLKHAEYHIEKYGEKGIISLRKHLPWYFKGIAGFRQFRAAAVQVKDLTDVKELAKRVIEFGV